MSKLAKPLTAVELRSLPDKSCVAVGVVSGLYARKRDERIYFFLRYSVNGIRRDFGIGSYPQLSLSQARIKAAEVRAMIENGEAPSKLRLAKRPVKIASEEVSQEVKRKADRTFEALGRKWVETRSLNGFWVHNKKGEIETLRVLELHVFPYLGKKDIDDITPEDVCETLSHIWQSKCHTARKAKTYIHKVFQWAIALRMRTNRENPAAMGGALGVLIEPLQKRKKSKSNFAAADVAEIPQLFKDMKEYISISARACEFAILTAARSQAVRLAQWDEFDLKQGLWTIPIEHDKIKIPNRDRTICLSTQAIELLNSLPRYPGVKTVFINAQFRPFSDSGLTMFLRGLHEKRLAQDGQGWIDKRKTKIEGKPAVITIHGTARATFRTWAKDDEIGNNRRFDQEAVELCLLHSKNDGFNGAYDRARLLNERRMIMQAWGDYCTSFIRKR